MNDRVAKIVHRLEYDRDWADACFTEDDANAGVDYRSDNGASIFYVGYQDACEQILEYINNLTKADAIDAELK